MKWVSLGLCIVVGCLAAAVFAQQAASVYYKFDVVAKTGQGTAAGTLTGFGRGPSVSEMGTVGFVGQLGSAGQSVFMGNGSGSPTWVSLATVAPNINFDDSVQINRTNQILANDQVSGAPPAYENVVCGRQPPWQFQLNCYGLW